MLNTNGFSKTAFAFSMCMALSACSSDDSGSGGGGGGGGSTAPTASDFCSALPSPGATYSNELSELVAKGDADSVEYRLIGTVPHGDVELVQATGAYTFTPSTSARGFLTTFTYGVYVDGVEKDTAVVRLIYGAKRIMPLGDSITFGVTHNNGGDNPAAATAIGYRKELYEKLTDNDYLVDFVGSQSAGGSAGLADTDHQGHPAKRSDQLPVSNYLTAAPADMVLSHVGTNDLFQADYRTNAAPSTENLISEMFTWSGVNNPLTVLSAKIVPPHAGSSLDKSIIVSFNNDLEILIEGNANFDSAHFQVHLVDQYSALDPATDLTVKGTGTGQDSVGLHPNTSGYTKMADTWYDALIDTGELFKCP